MLGLKFGLRMIVEHILCLLGDIHVHYVRPTGSAPFLSTSFPMLLESHRICGSRIEVSNTSIQGV